MLNGRKVILVTPCYAPAPLSLTDRAHAYAIAKANGDWREVVNARGALLGCVTADAVLALIDRSDALDSLLAIIAHGDPLEVATAAANLGGRT